MQYATYAPRKDRVKAGFTLVELSIVIIIVGLLTAGGLAVGSSMIERAAYIDTQKLIAGLQQSVKDYYIVNGRLPCVASFDDMPGSSDFGTEVFDPVATPSNCADSATVPAGTFRRGSPAVRIGMVPTRALGLPDSAASDKYGNRIVYAVAAKLTDSNQFGAEPGAITVEDMANNAMLTDGAFFIGSVGRDRKGGYNYKTTNIDTVCDTSSTNLDVRNCDYSNAIFRDAPFNNGEIEDTFFDDITAWTPKFHLTGMTATSDTLWAANGDANLYSVGTDDNTANTNVGIGTASPQSKLEVVSNSYPPVRSIRESGATDGILHSMALLHRTSGDMVDDFGAGLSFELEDNAGVPNRIAGIHALRDGADDSGALKFYTFNAGTGQYPMTLRSDGNVGIGTSAPADKLHVEGNLRLSSTTGSHIVSNNPHGSLVLNFPETGTIEGLFIRSNSPAGDYGSHKTHVRVRGNGYVGVGTTDPHGPLHVRGTFDFASTGKYLGYPPVASNHRNMAMVVENTSPADGGGMVLIITDDNNDEKAIDVWNTAFGNTVFTVQSNGRIVSPATYALTTGNAANMYVHSNGLLYRSTSSARYKKNIQDYSNGLDALMQLRPVSYEQKGKNDGTFYAGFIAEEVDALGLKEFVNYDEQGHPDALQYGHMTALITKAVQELKEDVDSLKAGSPPAREEGLATPEKPERHHSVLNLWLMSIMALAICLLAWRMLLLQRRMDTLS